MQSYSTWEPRATGAIAVPLGYQSSASLARIARTSICMGADSAISTFLGSFHHAGANALEAVHASHGLVEALGVALIHLVLGHAHRLEGQPFSPRQHGFLDVLAHHCDVYLNMLALEHLAHGLLRDVELGRDGLLAEPNRSHLGDGPLDLGPAGRAVDPSGLLGGL